MQPAKLTDEWQSGGPDAGRAPRTVLIVDDSKMQRKIMSTLLGRWGYAVLETDSGQSALEMCRSHKPDFILSDWMMPGMSGIELCEAYRALGLENYGYFILLTSRAEKDDVGQGLERGADDFVTKPVNSPELRGRLAAGERILEMHSMVNRRNRQLNDTIEKLQRVKRALDRDLDEARRLQQSLVPERYRQLIVGDVSLLLRPFGHVGGDLVGMFRVSETRIGLYGIDVAGHGIASALMTARLAGYLTGSSPDQNVALTIDEMGIYSMRSPDEVCEILNKVAIEDMETEHYFTMLLADCDLRTGNVRMSQAGHPSPLVLRADGSQEFIGTGGMPVGLIDGATYEVTDFQLEMGDRLLIYSDGVTECPDHDDKLLDEEGLAEIAETNRALDGPEFLEGLVWQLREYSGGADFPDDISAVLLNRNDSKPAEA